MKGEPKVSFIETGDQETKEVGHDLRPAPLRLSPRSRSAHAPRLSKDYYSQQSMALADYGGEATSSKIPPACGLAAIVSKFEILEAMTNLEKPEISTTVTSGPRPPREIFQHHSNRMMGKKIDPYLESIQVSSGGISAPESHDHSRPRQWLPDTPASTITNTRSRDKRPSTAGGTETGSMHNIVAERRQLFEPRTGCRTMTSKSASMPSSLHGTSHSGPSPPLTMKLRQSKTYLTKVMEPDSLLEASRSHNRSQSGPKTTSNRGCASTNSTRSREETAAAADVHAGGHDPLLMDSSEASRSTSKAIIATKQRSKLFEAIDALFSRKTSLDSLREKLELPPSSNVQSTQESGNGWESDGVLQCPGSAEQSFPAQIHASHRPDREKESNKIGNAAAVTTQKLRGAVMKTVQSRVTDLRKLFDMTAKEDDGPQLHLRRCHTGPQRNHCIDRSHAPIHSFDYDREFRLGFMIASSDPPPYLREYQSARASKDSTRSSLRDHMSAFESLSRSRFEISEPKLGTPSEFHLTPARGDEREERSERSPVGRRFESLGFKRGREVWRKLSSSWDKRKSANDGLDKHEDRHGTTAASPSLPTT
ncbi:hypothetical protein CKAH01_02271 [Colletotrichum kahawae]|uniref:Uncharacterized protein n=1 Tax=Colletotrichum kahawae TaxID=34407 RepID=A0AAE0D059_COLKA|nr:hypothetical protein CKAH01_02271 [Colletotrichum kahawae]